MTVRQNMRIGFAIAGVFLAAFVILSSPSHSREKEESQDVTVIDGDTLNLEGKPISLYGIDCPEVEQDCSQNGHTWQCGLSAKLHLDKILTLNRGQLHCKPWGEAGGKANDEPFVCEVGHEDVADAQLRGGYCVATPGAFPDYIEAERLAKEAGIGIWRGGLSRPWDRRKGNGAST